MLKGIPRLMSPELMDVLMRMGHGDDLVIADGNFPAETMGRRVVRADGHGVAEILDAVLTFLPVDDFIETPVKVMQPVAAGEAEPPVWHEYRRVIARHESRPLALTLVERFEFYDLARSAFAVVATTETAIYGNIIVKKGVVRSSA